MEEAYPEQQLPPLFRLLARREVLVGDASVRPREVALESAGGLQRHLHAVLEDGDGELGGGHRGQPETEVLVDLAEGEGEGEGKVRSIVWNASVAIQLAARVSSLSALGPCPCPSDTFSNFFPNLISSASFRRSAMGSAPAESTKMSGEEGEESRKQEGRSKGGGSTKRGRRWEETKSERASWTWRWAPQHEHLLELVESLLPRAREGLPVRVRGVEHATIVRRVLGHVRVETGEGGQPRQAPANVDVQ
eukprot:jgi/Chlat1/5451/Chrsp36S05445